MNSLKINGTALAGIYVDASLAFNKPAKDTETFRIPGRNGALVIDHGTWDNVIITFPCYAKSIATFESIINQLGALSGYQKIECTNDVTHFRMGVPIIPQAPTVKRINTTAWFNLSFNCKPQRFLTSGESVTTKTASGSITNPTSYASKPLLRITGTGTFTINGTAITIANHGQSYVDIDCEMQDCFYGSTNLNQYVAFTSHEFPTLSPGSNSFTFGTGITQVKITPRWWEL